MEWTSGAGLEFGLRGLMGASHSAVMRFIRVYGSLIHEYGS